MKRFADKVALVTGGSRGIGRAVCLRLAQEGAAVGVNFHAREDAAQEVVAAIEAQGGRALALQADVASKEQVAEMMDRVIETFGGLDIVVSNAGAAEAGHTGELTREHWQKTMDIDAWGVLVCAQEAARRMGERGGHIVNISSVFASRAARYSLAYSAAKGAVEAMTRCLALELAKQNIVVNCVAPGLVRTDMSRAYWQSERFMANLTRLTPAGRIAEPEDIAAVIAFLCSDDANWLRGQVITADGGATTTVA
ncbi:MAG: glucose 1-dehydrogenase [Armatimonadota bacterium]|nr:MAG: glucose 1-dehydrogenase [Armatimonadota bacterium]